MNDRLGQTNFIDHKNFGEERPRAERDLGLGYGQERLRQFDWWLKVKPSNNK